MPTGKDKERRRRLPHWLLVPLFLTVSLPCQAAYNPSFDQGKHFESTGDFKKAIQLYESLWQKQPDDDNVQHALIHAWRMWISKTPNDGSLYLGLGQDLERMKEFDLALDQFQQAKRLSPQLSQEADQFSQRCDQACTIEQQKKLSLVPGLEPWLQALKTRLEQEWQPGAHTGVIVIRVKVTFDQSGKVRQLEQIQGADDGTENGKIAGMLNRIVMPLPGGLRAIDVDLTFASDASAKSLETKVVGFGPSRIAGYMGESLLGNSSGGTGGAANDIDYGPYMLGVSNTIMSSRKLLSPPSGKAGKVDLKIQIMRTGDIKELNVRRSSGMPEIDQWALEVVRRAAPFKPLPPGSRESIDIDFNLPTP